MDVGDWVLLMFLLVALLVSAAAVQQVLYKLKPPRRSVRREEW